MFDRVCEQVRDWIQNAVHVSAVSFDPPGSKSSNTGVGCYLLELAEDPPLRSGRNAPLQLACHFLVTCSASNSLEANRLLGELIFAAMDHPQYQVLLHPPAAELWLAFATPPRPSFILRVPVKLERPQATAPRVRKPLDVDGSPIAVIHGVVLGPDGIPLAGARVELPTLRRVARTDADGRFRMPGVPAEPRTKLLRVSARGETRDVMVTQPEDTAESVVIQFDLP